MDTQSSIRKVVIIGGGAVGASAVGVKTAALPWASGKPLAQAASRRHRLRETRGVTAPAKGPANRFELTV